MGDTMLNMCLHGGYNVKYVSTWGIQCEIRVYMGLNLETAREAC